MRNHSLSCVTTPVCACLSKNYFQPNFLTFFYYKKQIYDGIFGNTKTEE